MFCELNKFFQANGYVYNGSLGGGAGHTWSSADGAFHYFIWSQGVDVVISNQESSLAQTLREMGFNVVV